MSSAPLTYHSQKQDRAASSIGKVSEEPLTWSVTRATVGAASGEALAAAAAGTVTRKVLLFVPSTETTGVYVNFGGTAAAAASGFFIPSGASMEPPGALTQAINAIRAGGSDVALHILVGVKT